MRVGEGLDATGELGEEPMERALETLELYAHFCNATGIEEIRPVATSAIRDASNQKAFLKAAKQALRARHRGALRRGRRPTTATWRRSTRRRSPRASCSTSAAARCSSRRVEDRAAIDGRSWPLGAVRMTERFLPEGGKAKRKQMKALRDHVAAEIERARVAGRGRPADRDRRHRPQPRRRRAARGRAAVLRHPGLPRLPRRARRADRDARRAAAGASAATCPASSSPAPT